MTVIAADAGPLIAFSRTSRLPLLADLFEQVLIPDEVATELRLEQNRVGVYQLDIALNREKWIRIVSANATSAVQGLDARESSAILLAEEQRCILLIDELRGRKTAIARGITVIGTGRVLIAAKEHGLIESVRAELDCLAKSGYRLSSSLCRRLLELAGES